MNTIKITKQFLHDEWVLNRKSQREIAEEQNVGLWYIEKLIKDYKLTNIRSKIKYTYNEDLFDINNPIFAYYIGFIVSDGYIDLKNSRVALAITDSPKILERLSKYFSKDKLTPVYKFKTKDNHYSYKLTISNKYLVDLLISLGVGVPNKTSNVKFPIFYNKTCFKMALRGFIDGDGNIRNTEHNIIIRWYSHSSYLVEDLKNAFKYWYNYDLSINPVKNKLGKEMSTRTDFWKHSIDLYEDYDEFCLERKKLQIKLLVDDIVHRYEMINHNKW